MGRYAPYTEAEFNDEILPVVRIACRLYRAGSYPSIWQEHHKKKKNGRDGPLLWTYAKSGKSIGDDRVQLVLDLFDEYGHVVRRFIDLVEDYKRKVASDYGEIQRLTNDIARYSEKIAQADEILADSRFVTNVRPARPADVDDDDSKPRQRQEDLFISNINKE